MLSKLSVDLSSVDFINPPARCMSLCLDQATKSLMLKELPTLDDIDIAPRQMGDQSRSVHIPGASIPGTDAAGARRGAGAASGPDKGKEKIAPSGSASKVNSSSASSDTETSTEEIAFLDRNRRLVRSDGSAVNGLPLLGQQAPKKAATPRPDPKVVAATVHGGSSGGGSVTSFKEVVAATTAVAPKKAAEAATPEEVPAVKKARVVKVAEEAATKTATAEEAATATTAVEEATTKSGDDGGC
jgi:hypothetical protein